MARTVEKILEDDKNKADLGIDEELIVEEGVETANDGPTPEEIAADLKKQLEAANARADREATARREAEARASTASTAAGTAVNAQIETHRTAVAAKVAAAQINLDSIKTQLKQAKAAGDTDAEVELSDQFTNARYELNAAQWEEKNFKTWEENEKKRQPAASSAPASPYTAKEQAWIDAHPEFGTSKKFARMAKVAAQEALDEGHKQDTPAYFNYIEETLKENGLLGTAEEPMSGAGVSTMTAAAPVKSGNGSSAPSVNKNSKYPYLPKGFTIPADWVQAAQEQGFDDPREYANDRLQVESEEKARR